MLFGIGTREGTPACCMVDLPGYSTVSIRSLSSLDPPLNLSACLSDRAIKESFGPLGPWALDRDPVRPSEAAEPAILEECLANYASVRPLLAFARRGGRSLILAAIVSSPFSPCFANFTLFVPAGGVKLGKGRVSFSLFFTSRE